MAPSTSDHNVTETAYDAIKCKLSAAQLGYFADDFLGVFVDKPKRRIPLIHRGYYLRRIALDACVDGFLAEHQAAGKEIQILSLGAGFDTLSYRVRQERGSTAVKHFVEVDCNAIVDEKVHVTTKPETFQTLFPGAICLPHQQNASNKVKLQVANEGSTTPFYSLVACDLGDVAGLEEALLSMNVNPSLPTLVIAECVVSYLDADRGTSLLKRLSEWFNEAVAVMYDPIEMMGAFGSTLQGYFNVKGCELRSLRKFQTPAEHLERACVAAAWKRCRIIDMNAVYRGLVSDPEQQRLLTLEAFDEFGDWALANAHYGITICSNIAREPLDSTLDVVDTFCATASVCGASYQVIERCQPALRSRLVVRSFRREDGDVVRKLFESSHLAYSCKAVRKFVAGRLASDMAYITRAFMLRPGHNFWVAELDGEVVGCVGLKARMSSGNESATINDAELCRLSVSKHCRRQKIATSLVATLERFARAYGYSAVYLETIGTMTEAQRLYEALGYTKLETQKFSSFELVPFRKSMG
ncbi:TPA: hypothetical protein N0F65_000433 [Lagenidium giganteum]|uniref:[phosphatase 2A protein]-leucine-carboxy methyltransferase n=1 Tax=Lagenidium giganteum TaxID=4803 RepID=A0AAV2YL22_9STRA|nr:TPA: hypothetical protein N0F65_000433 [Lagenidium giganteum]